MSKKDKKNTEKKISKKAIASLLFARFDKLLKEYQPLLGEKKYVSYLKGTANAFAGDIAEAEKKKKEKAEKETRKEMKKGKAKVKPEKKTPKQKKSKKIKEELPAEENLVVENEASEDDD